MSREPAIYVMLREVPSTIEKHVVVDNDTKGPKW